MQPPKYPLEFVEALTMVFGEERTERALSGEQPVVQMLFHLWDHAVRMERKNVFEYMRSEDMMSVCEDKEMFTKVSWVIGNGSYVTTPNLSERPWWMEEAEDWKSFVADRLRVWKTGPGEHRVVLMGSQQEVAHVSHGDDGRYHVMHYDDEGKVVTTRIFADWPRAMADVAANVTVREKRKGQNDDSASD